MTSVISDDLDGAENEHVVYFYNKKEARSGSSLDKKRAASCNRPVVPPIRPLARVPIATSAARMSSREKNPRLPHTYGLIRSEALM